MEVKKTTGADITKLRTILFLVGMCVSLSSVYGLINYKKYDKTASSMDEYVYEEEEVEVEQTVQEEEPPPPPEAPPQLEIVEDDIEIEEEQPEIEDTETDDNEKIEAIVPEEEPEETNEVFEFYQVQKKAEFKGGESAMMRFINENLVYPQIAIEEDIEGKIMVQFVVNESGSISQIQVISKRKLGFGCEEAAIAVVKKMSGMWTPALQRDKAVKMRFRLPVRFQLAN